MGLSKETSAKDNSVFRHMLRGSLWALARRWTVRLIGLVSTMILARLLMPADFGIVAMAALVMGFIRLFTRLGPGSYLIRAQDATPELCNTVWTVNVIKGFVVGALVILVAPLAVEFFDEPRLKLVFFVYAGVSILGGFNNVGMTLAQKELNFALDFRFLVYKRVVKFAVIIPLAFVLRSYWALVAGAVATAIAGLFLSYGMHSYRPRFGLKGAREILIFGASMIMNSSGRFIQERFDVLFIGHIANTAGIGIYNEAAELSRMLTSEVASSIGRGLFPSYSSVSRDRQLLSEAYLRGISAQALLFLPLGVGLSAIAPDAVRVLLGQHWLATIPVLKWLSIYATLTALSNTLTSNIYIVIGKEWRFSALRWIRVLALVPAVLIAGIFWGAEAVPIAVTISVAVVLPIFVVSICNAMNFTAAQILQCVWRPCVSVVPMYMGVTTIHPLIDGLILRLVCEISLGAFIYTALVFSFWHLSGRPTGIERAGYGYIRGKLGSLG